MYILINTILAFGRIKLPTKTFLRIHFRKKKNPKTMKYCWILLLLSALSGVSLGDDTCSDVVAYSSVWNAGASGKITVTFPSAVSSWTIAITFTSTITDFQVWVGDNIQCSGTTCTFENMSWNGNQAAGSTLGIDFLYYFDSTSEISGVSIDGTDVCGTNSGGSDTKR